MIGALSKLWHIWQHGLAVGLLYGFGLGMGFLYVALPAIALNGILSLFGLGMVEDDLFSVLPWLFPIWAPLGVGMAARYASSDGMKPEGYPSTSRRFVA